MALHTVFRRMRGWFTDENAETWKQIEKQFLWFKNYEKLEKEKNGLAK